MSACRYHQKSVEIQLHRPRPEFGGLNYQEIDAGMPDAALLTDADLGPDARWRDRIPGAAAAPFALLAADRQAMAARVRMYLDGLLGAHAGTPAAGAAR